MQVNNFMYIVFVLAFNTSRVCQAAFVVDAKEDYAEDVLGGDTDPTSIDARTPSVVGEVFLALLWILLLTALCYTGYWAFKTRNILWQILVRSFAFQFAVASSTRDV
jgi:hypothetical protein